MKFRFALFAIALVLISTAVCAAPSWQFIRRGEAEQKDGVLALRGKVALSALTHRDFELSCKARVAPSEKNGEIWLRLRVKGEREQLAVGFRGGRSNNLIALRYAPGGHDAMPALIPLAAPPKPGEWRSLRARVEGNRVRLFVDDLLIADFRDTVPSETGQVGFGGGSSAVEFRDIAIRELPLMPEPSGRQFSRDAIKINFQPASGPAPEGFKVSAGEPFDTRRGFGWDRDMAANMRRRGVQSTVEDDTLVAILREGQARFTVSIPNGEYVVTLCAGDPSYAWRAEAYIGTDPNPVANQDGGRGSDALVLARAAVTDGKLEITFRSEFANGGPGGAWKWIAIEPRSVASDKWAAAGESMQAVRAASANGKAAQRERERKTYRPVSIHSTPSGRRVGAKLDGRWLFLPEPERAKDEKPFDPSVSDSSWHLLDVPAFWTPTKWWIYGGTMGSSDAWTATEDSRVAALTFDAKHTKAGWYRHWIKLPSDAQGRRLLLRFQGVASICQVWFNGKPVGSHTGMFSPFELDVTDAAKPGADNLLCVFVSSGAYKGEGAPDEVVTTAVTVQVTREMLNALPHGMYSGAVGIYQPVSLIAVDPVRITDVYLKPKVDGGEIEVTVRNDTDTEQRVTFSHEIKDRIGKAILFSESHPEALLVPAGGEARSVFTLPKLAPRPWSPERPNLYDLKTSAKAESGLSDQRTTAVGFRTFEAKNGDLYLNGRRYFLRGSNHAPSGLRPNDSELAHKFLKLMHDGNQMVTRTHGAPYTQTWFDAADEEGVGVSCEGIWPWAMMKDLPSPDLLSAWFEDWLGLMRDIRNHPSILIWTVNNEMYFYNNGDAEAKKAKWKTATDLIGKMRALDPTRPVALDSGYVRTKDYGALVKANGFDDGDIDDRHLYYGWYSASPFVLRGGSVDRCFNADRPGISQEFSEGYPMGETGHPTRSYILNFLVPQAWVGPWAYEDRDPSLFLQRHAFLTKELAELVRRERQNLDGILHFATTNWFAMPFDARQITPWPVYAAMKRAQSPVLVSADLGSRHYFAGDTLRAPVWVVNDDTDGRDLKNLTLTVSILNASGRALASQQIPFPNVPYYGKDVMEVALRLPATPAGGFARCKLALELSSGTESISKNEYELLIANREPKSTSGAAIYQGPEAAASLLEKSDEFRAFIRNGGRAVILNGGEAVAKLLPEAVAEYIPRDIEIVSMEDELHPIFAGIEPLDLSWFQAGAGMKVPLAAAGGFRMTENTKARVLASSVMPHGYMTSTDIVKHYSAQVFEERIGEGSVLVSQMRTDCVNTDPVAARLYANMLRWAGGE